MSDIKEGVLNLQRGVRRCHEPSRLEEQLWSRVFEELWPVVTGSTRRQLVAETSGVPDGKLELREAIARGA